MAGFLIDQQLPARLAAHMRARGHRASHIKDYPGGTTLADVEMTRIADAAEWAGVRLRVTSTSNSTAQA